MEKAAAGQADTDTATKSPSQAGRLVVFMEMGFWNELRDQNRKIHPHVKYIRIDLAIFGDPDRFLRLPTSPPACGETPLWHPGIQVLTPSPATQLRRVSSWDGVQGVNGGMTRGSHSPMQAMAALMVTKTEVGRPVSPKMPFPNRLIRR